MSIVDAFQSGGKIALGQSKANVTINTGDGHSNINVTGNKVSIDTGCGDQDIDVVAAADLVIDTGECGEDVINARSGGNATITTREDNDTLNLYVAGNFTVDVGMDNPVCGATSDNDKVTIVSGATDGQSSLSTGEGNDSVNLIANNVDLKKGEGELTLGFIGNNYNINSEATKDMIAGWGDNVTMNLSVDEAGNHNVYTFDQLWADKNPDINSQFQTGFWQGDANSIVTSLTLGNGQEINFVNAMDQIIQSYEKTETDVDVKTEILNSKTDVTTTEKISGMTNAEVEKKYNFKEGSLANYDLSATLSDGSPKYAILNRNGSSAQCQLVERTVGSSYVQPLVNNKSCRMGLGRVAANSALRNDVSSTTEAIKTTTTTATRTDTVKTTTTTTVEDVKYRVFDGVKDWQINMGDGAVVGHITARDGYVNINHGEACNNDQVRDLIVDGSYLTREVLKSVSTDEVKTEDVKTVVSVDVKQEKINAVIKLLQGKIASPLILDFNKDGQVSAAAGQGIDINNDGKADGAATGGDKMLAMTDINGNGSVDGAEVFGDKTVSPFTGKALNAANGFEALKAIAEEAKLYTGLDCMNGSTVDVKKLEKALASVGVKLGFVSDDNNSKVEDLVGVSQIEVENYTESQRIGSNVEHLQHSVYTDENGVTYKVDDVWFEL